MFKIVIYKFLTMRSLPMVLLVFAFHLSLISAPIDAQRSGDCITPNRERGECILLEKCASLTALLLKKPLNDNDQNYLRRSQCGAVDGNVLVCCPSTRVTPQQLYPTRPRETTGPGNILPQPGKCGTGSTDRIYGGNQTKLEEFPWMALLEYSKPGNNKGFHCGGVLINSRYVLTAAHCLKGTAIPPDWRPSSVRLGEWDTSSPRDCADGDCSSPPLDVTIEELIVHEDYNSNPKRAQLHDIALLRLSREVPYSFWIKPICLPSAPHLRTATFEGFNMDVAGWGKTETASKSNIKLKARVDGVDLRKCNDVYKRYRVIIENSQVCAGGVVGIDSCQGDSGGPLMGVDKTGDVPYFYLAGIVSFGYKICGTSGVPGVYTRVGSYIDWIQSNIRL